MANRVLGIEFSPESIKLVEVSYGRRLKVFNFAIVDNRSIEPERRADQLNHTLQVRGFEAKEAVVAATGVQVEHRLLTLPPLSGRELKFVMQREAKKSAPAGVTETFWDYEILQAKEELGIKKRQVLLVTSATELVRDAQEFFGQTRLKIQRVTTVGESLLNLTKQVSFWKKEIVKNIVHFGPLSVHVLFIQQGTLLLCRDIPIKYVDLDREQRAERLLTEIKRTTLYFKQNFPQAEIDEVLFSGESDMIGALVSRARDDLGIEAQAFRFEDNLDPSSFRGEWDEFRFHIPSLTAAFGAAWHKLPEEGLNLIPGKGGTKEGPPVYKKLIKIAAILAVVLSLAAGARYFTGARSVQADLQGIRTELAALDPILQEAANADARRALARAQEQFMSRMASGVEWEEVFRRLSLIIPDTAVFETIQMEAGDDGVSLVITGNLRGTQGQPSNDFADFFEDLQRLDSFASVEMSQPPNVSFENAQLGDDQAPVMISRVSFEVRCVLNSSS